MARVQQAGDLDSDRLGLGSRAGASQQAQAVVGGNPLRARFEQVEVEVAQRRAFGVVVFESQGLLDGAAELALECAEQAGAGAERASIGVGDGHRYGAGLRELGDELELGAAEVVEAVDEDGPRGPASRIAAKRRQGSLGDQARIGAPGGIAQLDVCAVHRRELGFVAGLVEAGDRRSQLSGCDQRGLKLGDEDVEGGGEARARG